MKIYAVRHGQAQHNKSRRLNDDPTSRSDLTPKGRQQAQEAAQALKRVKLGGIYSSQLPRAQQTAEIINQHHGLKIETDSRLNELRSGFHGQPVWRWLGKRLMSGDNLHKRHNNGETLAEAKARVEDFLNSLDTSTDEAVLIVAHQHTMQVLSSVLSGHDYKTSLRRRIGHAQVLEFEL